MEVPKNPAEWGVRPLVECRRTFRGNFCPGLRLGIWELLRGNFCFRVKVVRENFGFSQLSSISLPMDIQTLTDLNKNINGNNNKI